jgi:thiamine biosynthesis lipoprotein
MASEPTTGRDTGLISGTHITEVMGTVVTFVLRDPVPLAALDAAIAGLHHADAVFSTYRSDSEISQLDRGERRIDACCPEVIEVLRLCDEARVWTDGYFTACPDGRLDPSGYVKGWAIERASDALCQAGSRHHAVNGGGDVRLVGGHDDLTPWRVGIADPFTPGAVLGGFGCRDAGVATSGSAERGQHITDPMTGKAADTFSSVSVVAPSLVEADVLATAAFARGESAIAWLDAMAGVQGLFVRPDGSLVQTGGFPPFI